MTKHKLFISLLLMVCCAIVFQGCTFINNEQDETDGTDDTTESGLPEIKPTDVVLLIANPASKYVIEEILPPDIVLVAPLPITTIDFATKEYNIEQGSLVETVKFTDNAIYIYMTRTLGTKTFALHPEGLTDKSLYAFYDGKDSFRLYADKSGSISISRREKIKMSNVCGEFAYEHNNGKEAINLHGTIEASDDIVVAHTTKLYSIHTVDSTNIINFGASKNDDTIWADSEYFSWLFYANSNPMEIEKAS